MTEKNRKIKKNKRSKGNQTVFFVSAAISAGIVIAGIIDVDAFSTVASQLMEVIQEHFSWLYLLSMFGFVMFSLWIAFSHFGSIRLGSDDSKPQYSTIS